VTEEDISDFLHSDYPRLVIALTMIAGSRAAAEDAVQEALARTWERSERGHTVESLSAWVRVVALNLVRSRLRRAMAERRALARMPESPRAEGEVELDGALELLAVLPNRQREIAVLHYYLDLSVDDVAHALGVSPGTVKTSLHRARHTLAARLQPDPEEANHVG
jgi:RNA polymerase sigma-70 factor (ECF subfamily)